MNKQRWNTVQSVLGDCLSLPPAERPVFAVARCGDDSELLREVLSLLEASQRADGFFERLASHADALGGIAAPDGMLDREVGPFRITAVLGSGGMGEVYRARDTRLHRDVALKVLGGEAGDDRGVSARLEREATLLAALNHPNVAAIYGREELDGRPVLVLELVEGVTLKDRLEGGALPPDEALRIACGVARGLEAAHDKGIVHRDLKPSNVMLTQRGEVKVLDFGIAKPAAVAAPMAGVIDLTATGVLLGTVPYMSPEQVRGRPLDQRADVWAFGCILYEMLAGKRAFERETVADTLAAIIEHAPDFGLLADTTPAALEDLIRGALAKSLQHRIDSIGNARQVLEAIVAERATGEPMATVARADTLERARELIQGHAWQNAFDILDPAFATLEADDLARLGQAAWWVGRADRSAEADQRAFRLYVGAAQPVRAAEMAIRLADHCGRRLLPAMVNGWLARARRLLEDQPLAPAHGWLRRAFIQQSLAEGRYDDVITEADELLDIAAQLRDLDLQALAIHYQGLGLIKSGRTAEGMRLIDEATVAAISGELGPMTTAIIYCNAVSACRSLADYRRAGEWTEAARRWCERQAISGFPGVCRVTRAEVLRLHGNWVDAEREALRACRELEGFSSNVARVAFHELGEIRLRMGEYDAARDAFDRASRLGRDPQPGAALLELAEGDVAGAAASIRRALEHEKADRLVRALLLPAQVEIALQDDDFDTARIACGELQEIAAAFDAAAVRAAAEHAYGALCLAQGDIDEAREHLRRAIDLWEEANVPYEAARARELQAHTWAHDGDDAAAQIEMRAACRTFVRLGAAHDSRRLAEMLADHFV